MATILFGGSFNPIHLGHLAMAKAALEQVPEATLVFMPAACSPFKVNQTLAQEHHRLAMCQLTANNDVRMQVSDMEFTMEKPSYTVHTVKRLLQEKPDEYYFLCGADSFLSLFGWKDIETLANLVTFLVANREGSSQETLQQQKEKIEGIGGKVVFLPMEKFPVSSTQVREALTTGKNAQQYVSPQVFRYIQENNLYQE